MFVKLSLEQIELMLKAMRWKRDRLKNSKDKEDIEKLQRLEKALSNIEEQYKRFFQ